jgi:hypothetical protein
MMRCDPQVISKTKADPEHCHELRFLDDEQMEMLEYL